MRYPSGIAVLIVISLMLLYNRADLIITESSTFSHDNIIENGVVFSIPLGDDGIHYSGDGNPDILPGGPEAFSTSPDGTYWIVDTADSHLLHFNEKGELLNKFYIGDTVRGASDIEVTSEILTILDIASIPAKVLQFSIDGKLTRSLDLPKDLQRGDGTTGLALASDGGILIEQEGGIRYVRFISPEGEFELEILDGYEILGKLYSTQPANLLSPDPSRGFIFVDDKQIVVDVTYNLGSLSILGVDAMNSLFVEIQEVVINGTIKVDQKVYRYDSFGNLTGMARVPLASQYIPVTHGLTLGPDGNVYALITKPDGGEVQRLSFVADLPPILDEPVHIKLPEPNKLGISSTVDCLSRSEILRMAEVYYENSTYLNSYHIDDPSGECTSRTKPPNLTSAGWYPSVPYAWGIADTVDQYNKLMGGGNNSFFAGDYTDPNSGCGRGVDCSGLISVAWNLGYHHGTCTLEEPSITMPLGTFQDLKIGDIVNRCSTTPRHVVLFEKFGNNGQGQGMWGYEATITTNVYRVDYTFRRFADLSGYTPRTYVKACDKTHLPILKKQQMGMDYGGGTPSPYPPPNPYP